MWLAIEPAIDGLVASAAAGEGFSPYFGSPADNAAKWGAAAANDGKF